MPCKETTFMEKRKSMGSQNSVCTNMWAFFFCDCELPRLALGKCVFVKVVVCMASCIHCAAYFNKTSFNWPEACVKAESQLKINLIFRCCCLSFCTLTLSWIFFCFFSVLAYYSLLFLHVISMFSVFYSPDQSKPSF